jgi:hypothetical protein
MPRRKQTKKQHNNNSNNNNSNNNNSIKFLFMFMQLIIVIIIIINNYSVLWKTVKENVPGSKYVNVPTDNISSWCTSSRGTMFTWGADIEQSRVSDIPSKTRRPTISKTEGQNLKPKKTWVRKRASRRCLLIRRVCNFNSSRTIE